MTIYTDTITARPLSLFTPETKVKVFSHNDLDGIGCGIVAKIAFPKAHVTYCGYNNLDERVKEFITTGEHLKYDLVFITDISVNEEVEKLINDEISYKVWLFDHHPTAMHLNDNLWASVKPEGKLGKNSGTNMLHGYLQWHGFFKREIWSDALEVFVEKVRRYDSWEWKDLYDDTEASSLNDLFWLLGQRKFEDKFIRNMRGLKQCIVREGSWLGMFDTADQSVLNVDHDKKVAYINRKDKQMFSGRLVGKNAGFVFAEQYISELGNELSDRHPELDFIVILDLGNKKVSYRTVKDIDLGKDVASKFGGGGHPKASGSELDIKAIKLVIPMLFGSKKLTDQLVSLITGKGLIGKVRKLVDKFNQK
jgi:oligoribonuclease NrnB/cAMP/cGMP phosphodiesterase (DHH superfamily)